MENRAPPPVRVLVVEDNLDDQELLGYQLRKTPFPAVLVARYEGSCDRKVGEQLPRTARVFRSDEIGFLKDAQGAQRDVLEVADRCRDDIESAGHSIGSASRRQEQTRALPAALSRRSGWKADRSTASA